MYVLIPSRSRVFFYVRYIDTDYTQDVIVPQGASKNIIIQSMSRETVNVKIYNDRST